MLTFKARRRRDPTASPFLTPSQRRVMNHLRDAMNAVRDQVIADEGKLLDAIMHRPLDQVVDMIPIDPWVDIQESIAAELEGDLIAGGHRYAQQVPAMRKATVNFRFDEPSSNASRWARTQSGTLITNVTTSQRNTVRTFVSGSLNAGDPSRTVARNLRNVVGLTPQQAGWVQNFEDRLVSRYVGEGMTLQAAQARAAGPTARYHARIHRYRTETIARTEILTASHEGRRQAWDQGLRQGFISPNARQEWSAEVDDRACAICEELDRTTVRIGEMFPDGDPPIHPMCRCDVLLIDEPSITGDIPTDMSDADLTALVDELESGGIAQLPTQALSLDEQIAKLEAEREPIRQQLVAADFGQIELPPGEYQRLLDAHKPIFDDLMRLKEEKARAAKPPTIQPTQQGVQAYDDLAATVRFTDEQADAIQQWQGNGYRQVQGSLYGRSNIRTIDPDTRLIIDNLDSTMDRLQDGTVLYRGQTRGLDNLQVGQDISTSSYVATSTDPITAGAFSQSSGAVTGGLRAGDTPTIMRISTKRAKGTVVPKSSEFEVILARNTKMTVTDIVEETIDGVRFRIIEVEA